MHLWRLLVSGLTMLAWVAAASAAAVPDLSFKTDRGTLKLQDLRGKVVYLDYWASWCAPCRESFPFMNELQARYRDKDFVVIAVTLDQDMADAQRFLARYPANFTIAYDPEGLTAGMLRVRAMPTTFLINQQGQIVATHLGFKEADKSKIEREINALLPAGTKTSLGAAAPAR